MFSNFFNFSIFDYFTQKFNIFVFAKKYFLTLIMIIQGHLGELCLLVKCPNTIMVWMPEAITRYMGVFGSPNSLTPYHDIR